MLYLGLAITIIVTLALAIWSISTLIGLFRARGVPFVSLTAKQLRAINSYVKLKQDDRLVDLGCGDGRVLRLFEKQGLKTVHGYEVNFWACLLGWAKNLLLGNKKNKIFCKNFRKVDLKNYNVVFCYLLEHYLKSLRDKFDQELKPGTKIISYGFEIKDWHQPTEIIYTNKDNKKLGRIFIYKIC